MLSSIDRVYPALIECNPFEPFFRISENFGGVLAPLNLNWFKNYITGIFIWLWGTILSLAQMDLTWWRKFIFQPKYLIKIYIFDMPYHCKFLSDFQKHGTVVIRDMRSLIWVSIIIISKITLKNNLEFAFFWNNNMVHPLEMLRFSQNRTKMLIWSWWSIISSAPLDPTRKGADDAP